jgi:hypothetical protein
MGQRPAHVRPPAYLSKSPPVPQPQAPQSEAKPQGRIAPDTGRPEPTRYGDWEKNGIAIDF